MNTKKLTIGATIILAALATGLHAAKAKDAPAKDESRVKVTFENPADFTDVRDDFWGSESSRNAYLEQLEEHLVKRGERLLAAGYTLAINITDVDMAGDFEPWRGSQFSDVRIVKDIYPPRIKLSYTITDATGKVVAEGDRKLSDMAFMMRITSQRQDNLRYEKELLNDWLNKDVKRLVLAGL